MLGERERGRLRTVTLPQGRMVADNATLQWSADGSRLLFSMRAAEWQAAARDRFLKETEAPIVVQSSDCGLGRGETRPAWGESGLTGTGLRPRLC